MSDSFSLDVRPADLSVSDLAEVDAHSAVTPVVAPDAAPAAVETGFSRMGLAPELLAAIADLGYTEPTSVQERTIPMALPTDAAAAEAVGESAYTDLMVSSQTGSGKTAAFLLPVLHTLLREQQAAANAEAADWARQVAEAAARGEPAPKRAKRKNPTLARNFKAAVPGALVLCPTRELAQQVAHDAIGLVQHCRGLRVANVVGGMPYAMQIARLQNADLVVATPGRLLDLQRSGQIQLNEVQFLVVDEADRMLDLGFADDLAEINQLTIKRRQTMMFSATFASRIQQLASRVMRRPQRVEIASPQEKHANIRQVMFWADTPAHKRALLDHWLRDSRIDQAIVFASTQIECDKLAEDLQQDGFSAVALHGALSQGIRNRRLMALRQGQVQILVATDVAARGIDVPTITHVFNFGLPMKAEDYTHRIGRTGRAGRDGLAITFAEFRDRRRLGEIEAFTHQPLQAETIPGLEPKQRFAPVGQRENRGGGRPSRDQDRREGFGRKGGFGDASHRGPRNEGRGHGFGKSGGHGGGSYAGQGGAPFGDRQGQGYGDRQGQGQGYGDGARTAATPARLGNGGKVFVPRDGAPRAKPRTNAGPRPAGKFGGRSDR